MSTPSSLPSSDRFVAAASEAVSSTWDSLAAWMGATAASTERPTNNNTGTTAIVTSSKSTTDNDFVLALLELAANVCINTILACGVVYLSRQLMAKLNQDPTADPHRTANHNTLQRRLLRILQRRDPTIRQLPELSTHEWRMAQDVLDPVHIETSFADIGGMETVVQEVYELAILPLVQPQLFADSALRRQTRGMLLYGPPGTGKTLLAKAIAKEAACTFLPLTMNKILDKWVGESHKLVAAAFGLARKLEPTILFLDELDTVFSSSSSESAHMDALKAEFLTLWDGVSTHPDARILVLGATNRPQRMDASILRRLPRTFSVPLPDAAGRQQILKILLRDEKVCFTQANFLEQLAGTPTKGYSGSDLKEMCRAAAMIPIQEVSSTFTQQRVRGNKNSSVSDNIEPTKLRPLKESDFKSALIKVQRTGLAAKKYGMERAMQEKKQDVDLAKVLETLLASVQTNSNNGGGGDSIPNL